MAELFDPYRSNDGEAVQDSIGFSGLKYEFFLKAKADLLARLVDARGLGFGDQLRALDVGCGVGALHPFLRLLFPVENVTLRAVERGLAALPLGAQYACSARV